MLIEHPLNKLRIRLEMGPAERARRERDSMDWNWGGPQTVMVAGAGVVFGLWGWRLF